MLANHDSFLSIPQSNGKSSDLNAPLTEKKLRASSCGFWLWFIGGAALVISSVVWLSSFIYGSNRNHLQSNPKILRFNDKGVFTIMQVAIWCNESHADHGLPL